MKPLKIAHRDGHTDVTYDSSGSYILTGGSDGKVCIWEGRDDTDTTSVSVGEKVFSMAYQGGRFFAATDENTIRIHTFPDGVGDGLVTRFTSPCRCFCLSDDGSLLVAGADDFKIKVISMEENECICLYLDHKAPILSVALDPLKEFAASASCDGTVKVWGIMDGATEKSLDILSKCNEASQAESLCQMCWSQDGEFLLVPVRNEVQIYLRSSWEMIRKISNGDIAERINVMKLSYDGKYLAIGCINGDMGIFDWQDSKLIDKHSHPKHLQVTSLAWHPKRLSELAFCDNMGQLGFVDTVLGSGQSADATAAAFDDVDDDMLVSASGNPSGTDNADLDEINKFLDGDDDENSIDIGSIKRSLLPPEDDEDAASVMSGKAEDPRPVQPAPAPAPSLPPPQSAFQPGSTPEHLSSRFMVWNSVGIIRQYDGDDENSVDVEFHDAATHHALHIDNKNDFTMGDVSSQAVLLATRGLDDNASKLFCMHFGSWDNHKEWSYDMPEGENIEAVTVSEHWAAVATSSRLVRFFSIGGLQRHTFSLPGDVVALASHGDRLLVAFHRGMGSTPGDQCMGVYLLKVGRGSSSKVILNGEALPLSRGSKLAWLGFSDEGLPFYMDVEGVVRTLYRQCWTAVANTKQHTKGKSDHFWIVSISARHQQIRCVPCKGSRFPATLPRPALGVLPMQLPLCDMESEKSKYEEAYQRSSMISRLLSTSSSPRDAEEIDKPVREAIVKLFAFAAKSERDFRALEVCEMMADQSLLQIAATYAMRLRRMALAERVSEYMHQRQTRGTEDDGEDDEIGNLDNGDEDLESYNQPSNFRSVQDTSDVEDEIDSQDTEEMRQPQSSGPQLVIKSEKGTKSVDRPSGRLNPFKVAGSADRKSLKGTQIFDKMEKTTPKASPIFAPLPVNLKKSGKKINSSQSKLFGFKKDRDSSNSSTPASPVTPSVKKELSSSTQSDIEPSENMPVKKKASAFDLWFEANKEELVETHPEVSEDDLGQIATEGFRALTKEERQEWVQKAKATNNASGGAESNKKRKMSEDISGDQQKSGKTTDEDNKKPKIEMNADKKAPLSQATNAKLARFAKSD